MIGIYKITNKVNGHFYIGQSTDTDRRYMEHMVPHHKVQTRLYIEIQKYGKENFEFEVIEECKKEELKAKELHYIRTLKPYYNEIGKPRKEDTKAKLREAGRKQWADFSEEQRQKVIRNNLKRPPKGHTVSEETRRKISETLKATEGVEVMIIETGMRFRKIQELEDYLGTYHGAVWNYFKGNIKTVKGYHIAKV